MLCSGAGIGTQAVCVNPPVTPTPFYAATQATQDQVFLVIIEPFNLDPDVSEVETFYFSDAGYKSPSVGVNPDLFFEGRVSNPLDLSWNIPVTPEADRRVMLDIVNIELINADGALDALVDGYDIGGRNVTVLFGLKTYPFDWFTQIWKGTAVSWLRDFGKLDIACRDIGYTLDVTLQEGFYTGAGGAGGMPSLTGIPKPLAFGVLKNITPVLMDQTNLIYQVHDGAIQDFTAVYDKGVSLGSPVADYFSYADLVAASVSAGHFATSKSLGLFKLGAAPAGQVTADVSGDTLTVDTNANLGMVARRIMTNWGDVPATQMDTPKMDGFGNLAGIGPGGALPIGYYIGAGQSVTVSDTLSELMASCSSWWGTTADGKFTFGRLETPSLYDVIFELMPWDVIDVDILDPPEGSMPPRYRQKIAGNRNWTVQSPTDLADSIVGTSQYIFATRESEIVGQYGLGTIQNRFLLAQDGPLLQSFFSTSSTGLNAEAQRIVRLLGDIRQLVKVTIDNRGLRAIRGACVWLTEPRVNDGEAWLARIVGAEIRAADHRVDLLLWGPPKGALDRDHKPVMP